MTLNEVIEIIEPVSFIAAVLDEPNFLFEIEVAKAIKATGKAAEDLTVGEVGDILDTARRQMNEQRTS